MHHTMVLARFKKEFAEALGNADALYAESILWYDAKYADQQKFLAAFKKLNQRFKLLGDKPLSPKEEKEMLAALTHENPLARFFHALEAMAREKGLAVAAAEPQTSDETIAIHQYVDRVVKSAKPDAVMLTGGMAAFSLLGMSAQLLRSKLTRRQAIFGGAAAAAGMAGGGLSGLSMVADSRVKNGDGERAGSGVFSKFLYNFEDYRDAVGSAGLQEYCRILARAARAEGKPKPRVLVVYGAGHRAPIKHYNAHPMRRKASIQAYQPTFGTVEKPSLMMHRPIRAGNTFSHSHEHRALESY